MTTDTATYVRGFVDWEGRYTHAFPAGIPCYYDPSGARYGYPAPLFDYPTTLRVVAILSDPTFVAYAWVDLPAPRLPLLVEVVNARDGEEADVRLIEADDDGLYQLDPGLLWDARPAARVGLVRFTMTRTTT
jgi:hypothetical protein